MLVSQPSYVSAVLIEIYFRFHYRNCTCYDHEYHAQLQIDPREEWYE